MIQESCFFRWSIACKRFIRRGRIQKARTPESPKLSVFDLSLRKQRRSLHNSLQLLHPLNFPFETSQLGVYLGRVGWEVWFHSSSSWDLKAAEKAQQSEKEAAAAAAAAQSEKEAQQANAMAALINAARHAVGRLALIMITLTILTILTEYPAFWCDAKDDASKFFFSTRWGRGLALTSLKNWKSTRCHNSCRKLRSWVCSRRQKLRSVQGHEIFYTFSGTCGESWLSHVMLDSGWGISSILSKRSFCNVLVWQADSELLDLVKEAQSHRFILFFHG